MHVIRPARVCIKLTAVRLGQGHRLDKGQYALAKQGVNTLLQRLNFHSHSAVRVFKRL